MFRGNHPTRIDEKGRLKVPADFKKVLDENRYGNRFYITSKNGTVAEIYPLSEWQKIEEKLLTDPPEGAGDLLKVTSFWGQEVEIDAQGRLLLPSMLREEAGLNGDVAVVGSLTHLKVSDKDAYLKEAKAKALSPETEKALTKHGIY